MYQVSLCLKFIFIIAYYTCKINIFKVNFDQILQIGNGYIKRFHFADLFKIYFNYYTKQNNTQKKI